jgi:hypothetical protein
LDLREPDVKSALQSTLKVIDEEIVWEGDTFYDFETESFIDKEKWLIESGYELVENDENRWGNYKTYRAKIDLQNALYVGRSTSYCVGNDLLTMVREDLESEWQSGLGSFVQSAIDKLGLDNVLFIRESDEGSGGFLSGEMHQVIKEKSLGEMEYH